MRILSWSEAKAEAEGMGSYLATVTEAAEDAFVQDLIRNEAEAFVRGGAGFDIGGSVEPAGGFRWITAEGFT
ncbi:MAG: hypothetical protein KC933_35705 [Myxococcales bacterium]|nr:hypothetical protein [Myxococcales bacterium]